SLSARFTIGPPPRNTLPVGESFGSSVKRQSVKRQASAGSVLGNGCTTEPTKVQPSKRKPGLFGQADQVVVPTKRQSAKRMFALSPLSATIPAPSLSMNLQRVKEMSRTGAPSASISTPAEGGLLIEDRPVWLNSQSSKSKPLPPVRLRP